MRIEELFDEMGMRYRQSGEKYISACPVHGGKKLDKFRFWPEGHTGHSWHCASGNCQAFFPRNIIGLVQGYLSHEKYGWEKKGDETSSWVEAITWLSNWLKIDYSTLKADISKAERQKFAASIELLTKGIEKPKGICSRSKLRSFLEIPAPYFVERGYSPALLNEFDVGFCSNPKSEMYNRTVVPIYDDEYKNIIGLLGRTHEPRCETCGMFHHPDLQCPEEWQHATYCKWKVGGNFNDKNHLYNFWQAKSRILSTRSVVVVEGAGDVWRLVSCGIGNVVGLFGSELSEPQLIKLECSGATSIICLTDNDDAGNAAYEQLRERCWFASEISRPKFEGHDVGGLTEEFIVNSGLKRFIESKIRKM